LLASRSLECVTLAPPENILLTLCGNATQSKESLLRFDAVLLASETRLSDVQLVRLLRVMYKMPVIDLIMDTSMAPRHTRCIDFEVHTQSAATIYRLLTKDIPRCCLGLSFLQTHHFKAEENKKTKRNILAKMLSKLYKQREIVTENYLSEFEAFFQILGFQENIEKSENIEEHFVKVFL
jgi:hypothetical protein